MVLCLREAGHAAWTAGGRLAWVRSSPAILRHHLKLAVIKPHRVAPGLDRRCRPPVVAGEERPEDTGVERARGPAGDGQVFALKAVVDEEGQRLRPGNLNPSEVVVLPEPGDVGAEDLSRRVSHRRVEFLPYPLTGPGEERVEEDPLLHEQDPDRPEG